MDANQSLWVVEFELQPNFSTNQNIQTGLLIIKGSVPKVLHRHFERRAGRRGKEARAFKQF